MRARASSGRMLRACRGLTSRLPAAVATHRLGQRVARAAVPACHRALSTDSHSGSSGSNGEGNGGNTGGTQQTRRRVGQWVRGVAVVAACAVGVWAGASRKPAAAQPAATAAAAPPAAAVSAPATRPAAASAAEQRLVWLVSRLALWEPHATVSQRVTSDALVHASATAVEQTTQKSRDGARALRDALQAFEHARALPSFDSGASAADVPGSSAHDTRLVGCVAAGALVIGLPLAALVALPGAAAPLTVAQCAYAAAGVGVAVAAFAVGRVLTARYRRQQLVGAAQVWHATPRRYRTTTHALLRQLGVGVNPKRALTDTELSADPQRFVAQWERAAAAYRAAPSSPQALAGLQFAAQQIEFFSAQLRAAVSSAEHALRANNNNSDVSGAVRDALAQRDALAAQYHAEVGPSRAALTRAFHALEVHDLMRAQWARARDALQSATDTGNSTTTAYALRQYAAPLAAGAVAGAVLAPALWPFGGVLVGATGGVWCGWRAPGLCADAGDDAFLSLPTPRRAALATMAAAAAEAETAATAARPLPLHVQYAVERARLLLALGDNGGDALSAAAAAADAMNDGDAGATAERGSVAEAAQFVWDLRFRGAVDDLNA